jgi:hypothetical protein
MMTSQDDTIASPPSHPSAWSDATRAERWAGEIRVNLIRLIAIVLFYSRHLIEMYSSPAGSSVRGRYHLVITAIALAWAIEAVVLHVWLSRRRVDWWLKYAAVLLDVLMITLICAQSMLEPPPSSALVLLYFAVIASAPLRLSLRLVYVATAASMLGYLFLLGFYAWHVVGFHNYYATPSMQVGRSREIITLLALLTCGLFAGQVVRQIKRMILTSVTVMSEG